MIQYRDFVKTKKSIIHDAIRRSTAGWGSDPGKGSYLGYVQAQIVASGAKTEGATTDLHHALFFEPIRKGKADV